MWVRSEYAGELAVLSAWLCALLPWGVTVARLGEIGMLFRIHFPFLFFQFLWGANIDERAIPVTWVSEAPGFPESQTMATAYTLWLVAAAIFALALALSVLYYVLDERLEARSPVDPVRLMGGLLVGTAVVLSGALWLIWGELAGVTLPVGVAFMYVFGALLLVVERTDSDRRPGQPAGGRDPESDPEIQ